MGASTDRPAFRRLLQDIESGGIDIVAVYKLDRLSRSINDFVRLTDIFKQHGVRFISTTHAFDTSTSVGRMTVNLLATFATFEREMISERTSDKVRLARRAGRWTGGTVPLGYNVTNKKLIVDEDEAGRVREAFQLYLQLGSTLAVAEELNRRGWKTKSWTTADGKEKHGRAFDRSAVRSLLTNPIYLGKARLNGELHDGLHDPIVDQKAWQAVQTGGGAVVCVGAAPILRNCVISENAPPFGGQLFGGGVYCGGGARPTIVNCTISRNVASLAGGGVFCGPRSAPTIIDSTISHNVSSDRSAGGVHGWSDTNVRIEGCTISGNVGGGGGVFIGSPSVGTIANCEISGNVASGRGGGVLVFGGTTITGCRIWGNVAEVGGGVCTVFPVTNCVIWGNRAVIGGGIYLGAGLRGRGPITNCTIMGNFADFGGGVASKDTSSPRIFNSIVWGDWGGSATDRESGNDILLGVTNSCIELSQPMALPEGTIAEDPRFRGDGIFDFDRVVTVIVGGLTHNVPDFVVEAPDLRLRAESPCVGTGTLEGAPETDIEGTARPCGAGVGVDMGAFESCSPLHAPFLRGDCNNDGEVGGSTTEAIVLLRFAFLAGDRPPCLAACDADADGTDAVRILRSAFLAQQPPEPPFPECGVSDLPSDISLGCEIPPASCR